MAESKMNKLEQAARQAFETWWEREGQEFLFALNTTTDDDIKLVAEIAWKNGAYCAEQAEQEPEHSEHYWQHEINNARADGYERGYVAAKKLYAEQAEQKPVAYTNKEQLGYLKDPRYQAAPMAMWSKPFDKRINIPLYAAPVRTKDLTDDEIEMIFKSHIGKQYDDFARAVIAADREKNK